MSSYHGEDMLGVKPRKKLLLSLKKAILAHTKSKGVKVGNLYLVGRGISGVSMAATLSYMIGCRWGYVRKDTDRDNHDEWVIVPYNWKHDDYNIAVDDFVSTGSTIRAIMQHIRLNAVAVDIARHPSTAEGIYHQISSPHLTIITPNDTYTPEAPL